MHFFWLLLVQLAVISAIRPGDLIRKGDTTQRKIWIPPKDMIPKASLYMLKKNVPKGPLPIRPISPIGEPAPPSEDPSEPKSSWEEIDSRIPKYVPDSSFNASDFPPWTYSKENSPVPPVPFPAAFNDKYQGTCLLKGVGTREPYWQPRLVQNFFHNELKPDDPNTIHFTYDNTPNITSVFKISILEGAMNEMRPDKVEIPKNQVISSQKVPEFCRTACQGCVDKAQEYGAEEFICTHTLQNQLNLCRASMLLIDRFEKPVSAKERGLNGWRRYEDKLKKEENFTLTELPLRIYGPVFFPMEDAPGTLRAATHQKLPVVGFDRFQAVPGYPIERKSFKSKMLAGSQVCMGNQPCYQESCLKHNILTLGYHCEPHQYEIQAQYFSPVPLDLPRWAALGYDGLVPAWNDERLLVYYIWPRWPESLGEGVINAAALDAPLTPYIPIPKQSRAKGNFGTLGRFEPDPRIGRYADDITKGGDHIRMKDAQILYDKYFHWFKKGDGMPTAKDMFEQDVPWHDIDPYTQDWFKLLISDEAKYGGTR